MEVLDQIDYMTRTAIAILAENEDYALCGSLALIIDNKIPEREVGDLDFVYTGDSNTEEFKEKLKRFSVEDYKIIVKDEYTCYSTQKDAKGFYYNLFVFKDSSQVKTVPRVITVSNSIFNAHIIQMQDSEQILEYKREWARYKDNVDLGLRERNIIGTITYDDIPF